MKQLRPLFFPAIVILGFLLRFYLLGISPASLNTDEAAIGYNAYSLLKSGKDEYGQPVPLAFRSFDDYKPPLYVYFTTLPVALFGLNEFSVRLPSAIIGVLAIITTYFLARKLFGQESLALLSAFLLAISPWHLGFTRTAFEAGSLAFFTGAGFYFFLKGSKKWFSYVFSAVFFALSTYLYQAAKVFTPLFVVSLLLCFVARQKRSLTKKILIALLFALFLFPAGLSLLSPQGSFRFRGLSVFSDTRPQTLETQRQQVDWLAADNRSARLFHHPELATLPLFVQGYLAHFRPEFLFLGVGDSRLPYVDHGLLYLLELPLCLLGLYFLWRHQPTPVVGLISLWLFLAPLPAAAVVGSPNSIRDATNLPGIYFVVACGLLFLVKLVPRRVKLLTISITALLFVFSLSYYLHQLFIHAPGDRSPLGQVVNRVFGEIKEEKNIGFIERMGDDYLIKL